MITDLERYSNACHAMQSGVATQHGYDDNDASKKHLRVGINIAMCEHAALVTLLIGLGVITDAQYTCAMANLMEKEVKRYEEMISQHFGTKVTLH